MDALISMGRVRGSKTFSEEVTDEKFRKRPKDVVSRNMSQIRSTDTKIECMVRSNLWKRGYRYRKNYSKLPGKPDIAILKEKIAVFCDSDFWHGRDWRNLKKRLRTNPEYWIPKIERNRARDRKVNKEITSRGWIVMRFWEKEILKDVDSCVQKIVNTIEFRREEIGR